MDEPPVQAVVDRGPMKLPRPGLLGSLAWIAGFFMTHGLLFVVFLFSVLP